ncbi:MAG: cob(I)yrinic acid a,c-diamide adenosyltransferase [Muribaculaceae bacterium]|nr:cob(I)yrinic acid a,c-diamide adenosyltransferase [Muribaculaceae bacterium]
MAKVYTRTGDKGSTTLVGGTRVAKTHPRLEAYGTLDELNSWLGLVAAYPAELPPEAPATLLRLQDQLFHVGTILSTEPSSAWQPAPLSETAVTALEADIDTLQSRLAPLRQFILPGGTPLAARAHIARTVARRAERRIIALQDTLETPLPPVVISLVNRISDYLFVLARAVNAQNAPDAEKVWQNNC